MKRLLIALAALLVAGTALAFDPRPADVALRIGVLRPADTYTWHREVTMQRTVVDVLGDELRKRGFDAYEVDLTFTQLEQDPDRDADFYVEIVGAGGESFDYGGLGVGGRHADVSFGLIVSRVAAELRVYDGRTLQTLATKTLSKKNTAVLPTSIGIGGSDFFAVFAMPFVERAQLRSVARAAARDAAVRVADAVREQ